MCFCLSLISVANDSPEKSVLLVNLHIYQVQIPKKSVLLIKICVLPVADKILFYPVKEKYILANLLEEFQYI